MPLSWNEIRTRAISFVKEWDGESRERAEKDSFWNDFFNVFGISRRRVATFEEPVKKLNDNYGFIDLFWKGKLLVEHKSKGKDLEKAYTQALDYFEGLKERELPKYILVSDFEKFKLYDLDNGSQSEFALSQFVDNVSLFGFIAGYEKRTIQDEDPVNVEAAAKMGVLHDLIKDVGYEGHQLEVLLVRLLFCLFSDDTGIFNRGIFQEYIDLHTKEDGSDLAMHLAQIFQILDTPIDKRQSNLDDSLSQFPYVNGELFSENIRIAHFDSAMREMLLEAGAMDWGEISPAIFGSMFQAAMNPKERRNLGAHYTSEKNIMKVIKPLFLDELWSEFHRIKRSNSKLIEFHEKISALNFLDPACGSGNFLIITYRELRLLELEILRAQHKDGQGVLDIRILLKVSITQFYGIEIDEFAAKVAEVGMWLVEHQVNELFSLEFGQNIINLPLKGSANITNANALRIEWEKVISKDRLSYIIGNPPFYGKQYQSESQREDMHTIFSHIKNWGVLDYVSCWFFKSIIFINNTGIQCSFVSTNSIVQGEQTSILFNELFKNGIKINFAHRTFKWSNKAKDKAAVHCVILGFGFIDKIPKKLFEYENIGGEPLEYEVKKISPYLVEAGTTLISKRTKPLSNVKPIFKGNQPTDGGNLLLNEIEKDHFVTKYPEYASWIKPVVSGKEYLKGIKRFCFWLPKVKPSEIKKVSELYERCEKVKSMRLNSSFEATRELANTPTLFRDLKIQIALL